jgi:hypothetical protein
MCRWPVLVVLSVGPWLAGCSPAVQAGLANAPRLGGTAVADTRVNDVISNGDDACGRHGETGPLRGRIPPCPGAVHPVVSTWLAPTPSGRSDSLVLPWLEHFYAGWPCPRSAAFSAAVETRSLAAWAAPTVMSCSPEDVTDVTAPR